ncbi:MAG: hypothetical protein ABI697_09405 [Devosia sp.]
MARAAARPPQSDRQRRAYFDAFAARFPALTLRWGNTFSRWRDVPGTELVLAYYITNHSVGVFVRGQRGIPCRDTAANLPAFSLETGLGVPLGNPDFPFGCGFRFDPAQRRAWPESQLWLGAMGERYVATLAELVGGLTPGD